MTYCKREDCIHYDVCAFKACEFVCPYYMRNTCDKLQGEWILVSERLPEIDKEVIVTDIETEDTYCTWYQGNGYWACDNGVFKNRIIAWQPLPEPYKKGGAE